MANGLKCINLKHMLEWYYTDNVLSTCFPDSHIDMNKIYTVFYLS
jgi:hypothetical protein